MHTHTWAQHTKHATVRACVDFHAQAINLGSRLHNSHTRQCANTHMTHTAWRAQTTHTAVRAHNTHTAVRAGVDPSLRQITRLHKSRAHTTREQTQGIHAHTDTRNTPQCAHEWIFRSGDYRSARLHTPHTRTCTHTRHTSHVRTNDRYRIFRAQAITHTAVRAHIRHTLQSAHTRHTPQGTHT